MLDDAKPFDGVTAASIELEVPLVPLRLFEERGAVPGMCVRTDYGNEDGFYGAFDTIYRRFPASAESLCDVKLLALIPAKTQIEECSTGDCDIEGCCQGLIVTHADASGDRVKHLGFIVPIWIVLGMTSHRTRAKMLAWCRYYGNRLTTMA